MCVFGSGTWKVPQSPFGMGFMLLLPDLLAIYWRFLIPPWNLSPHNSKPLPTVIGFSCYFVPQNIETNSKAKLKCTKTILKLQFPASPSQIFFTFSPSTELAAAGGHVVVCELLLDALADVHKCFPQLSGDLTSWWGSVRESTKYRNCSFLSQPKRSCCKPFLM